jgi:hypothetical protein
VALALLLTLSWGCTMSSLLVVALLVLAPLAVEAQSPGTGSGQKSDGSAIQHGAQPDPGAVRPGTREGDAPSASAGTLVRDPVERRILGLPVTAAMTIAGVLIVLAIIGAVLIPRSRRRERARGGGTYGPPS